MALNSAQHMDLGDYFYFSLRSSSLCSNSSEVESIRERNVVDPAKRRILKCIMGAAPVRSGRGGLTAAACLPSLVPSLVRSTKVKDSLWKPFLNKNAPFPTFSPRPSRDLCIRCPPSLASPPVRKQGGPRVVPLHDVWLGQRVGGDGQHF